MSLHFLQIAAWGNTNMSSLKLGNLINLFPENRAALHKLAGILDKNVGREDFVLSAERLYDLITPSSISALNSILSELVDAKVLRQILRIESDAGGGIGDFDTLLDVPSSIYDFRLDREVETKFENIRLLYKITGQLPDA